MTRNRALLTAGFAVFVVAWFLPVIEGGARISQGQLPGWEAFRFALGNLTPGEGSGEKWWSAALAVTSALTNLLPILTAFALVLINRRPSRLLGGLLIAAGVLNLYWLAFSDRSELRVGYYAWVGAFWLLAFGVLSKPRETAAA